MGRLLSPSGTGGQSGGPPSLRAPVQCWGQNLGSVIGVAVASSIAASRSHFLANHGHSPAAALTGGFGLAMWVCGLAALAAVPVVFGLVHRRRRAPR